MVNLKVFLFSFLAFLTLLIPSVTFADVYVNGYYRSNGTYVQGHYRSSPDGNPYNNYSYPGNTNPYTGKVAPGNPSTYINNYYGSNYSAPTYTPPSYTPPSYIPSTYYGSSYSGLNAYESIAGGYKSYGILFCDSGYYEKKDKCIKAPKNSKAYGGSTFTCEDGYKKSGSKCVIAVKNSTYKSGIWTCNSGLYLNNDESACITLEEGCQEDNKASHYAGNSCYSCPTNFILNPADVSCHPLESSPIKANGCPKSGGGINAYTGTKCKK